MLIRKPPDLPYSAVTPRQVYLNRRRFLAAAAFAAGVARGANKLTGIVSSSLSIAEKTTPYAIVTQYNNFYEFGTSKDEPARNAKDFRTSPWTVSMEGEVAKPKTLDLDAILKLAPLEQRIARHRCVEG
jgi:methionine sulfoxide reductase catalytic subunit